MYFVQFILIVCRKVYPTSHLHTISRSQLCLNFAYGGGVFLFIEYALTNFSYVYGFRFVVRLALALNNTMFLECFL
jgi:hypothetical protein